MINMFKAKLVFSSLLLLSGSFLYAEKLQEEKELEIIDFQNIKNVLKQDGLSGSAIQKTKQVQILKKEKVKVEKSRFFYPEQDELWGFVSEYWLIKNAQVLSWDFEKPNYGL